METAIQSQKTVDLQQQSQDALKRAIAIFDKKEEAPSSEQTKEVKQEVVRNEQEHGEKKDAPEAEKKEEESTDPLGSKFARLARREKQVRLEEQRVRQELKAQQDQISVQQKEMQKYVDAIKDAKNDPAKIFALAGTNYEELTEWYLNGGQKKSDPFAELKKEIEVLKAE